MMGEVYAGPKKKTIIGFLVFTLVWGKQDGGREGNGRREGRRMRIAKKRAGRRLIKMPRVAENK
jgi:hypothetical protein